MLALGNQATLRKEKISTLQNTRYKGVKTVKIEGKMAENTLQNQTSQGISALKESVKNGQALAKQLGITPEEVLLVTKKYRVRVPQYYLSLIESENDPIWRQAIPSLHELTEDGLAEDPFAEDDPQYSPVPHLTHRYPDRVLLLVTDVCPMYCRFCMRKRKTQKGQPITKKSIEDGIAYIRETPQVREVILSGGDPLMLTDRRLDQILSQLRKIPHLEIIRIHTKMPCVQPQRVTPALAQMIAAHCPVFMIVHFNHPREITPQSSLALKYLADAGIPLNNQSVLLKDVNDDVAVQRELCLKLLHNRVRPYYLHQADLVHGTNHFRTRVEKGLEIIQQLRGQISGLAVPQYVIDGPGGGGKIPLYPDIGQTVNEQQVVLKNCEGGEMIYPQVLSLE